VVQLLGAGHTPAPERTGGVKGSELDKEITILSDPELAVVRIRSRPVEKVVEEVEVEEEVVVVVAEEAVETPEAASLPEQKSKEE